ncbi:MAG: dihydropteroate synthase [Methanosarcinaceae archaeon]|nr:dihydropteroate synthase [Methanosarcinaceae archaeon]
MVIDVDICGLKIGDRHPVQLMGAINLSRESFYKPSVVDQESVLDTALRMVNEGASIIDVGARSTWPLAKSITKEEERALLMPVLEELQDNVEAVISVDTMFADIAEEALKLDVDIINDVSGFTADSRMVEVVAEYSCPAVVMASKKIPGDPLGMYSIMNSLESIIKKAEAKGIDNDQLILDPAIGKWVAEKESIYDFETIDDFECLKIFGKPLLSAISRKSFIGAVLGKPAEDRLFGTLAATAIVVYKGAHIIRTHDVGQTMDVVRVANAVRSMQSIVKEDRFEVTLLDIKHPQDSVFAMRSVGTTETGCNIMKNKTVNRVMRINNLTTTEALIIKQEILARGGDAALSRDAVSHEIEYTDLIVTGTLLQIERLVTKLRGQARNLPVVANMIEEALERQIDLEYRYSRET